MKTYEAVIDAKIMTLMQFARKAGKMVNGRDACIRAIKRRKVYLVMLATDYSEKRAKQVIGSIHSHNLPVHVIKRYKMKELSNALGFPVSGVYGIVEKGFSDRIFEYDQASKQVEENCQ